jgi:hypothetical protein
MEVIFSAGASFFCAVFMGPGLAAFRGKPG